MNYSQLREAFLERPEPPAVAARDIVSGLRVREVRPLLQEAFPSWEWHKARAAKSDRAVLALELLRESHPKDLLPADVFVALATDDDVQELYQVLKRLRKRLSSLAPRAGVSIVGGQAGLRLKFPEFTSIYINVQGIPGMQLAECRELCPVWRQGFCEPVEDRKFRPAIPAPLESALKREIGYGDDNSSYKVVKIGYDLNSRRATYHYCYSRYHNVILTHYMLHHPRLEDFRKTLPEFSEAMMPLSSPPGIGVLVWNPATGMLFVRRRSKAQQADGLAKSKWALPIGSQVKPYERSHHHSPVAVLPPPYAPEVTVRVEVYESPSFERAVLSNLTREEMTIPEDQVLDLRVQTIGLNAHGVPEAQFVAAVGIPIEDSPEFRRTYLEGAEHYEEFDHHEIRFYHCSDVAGLESLERDLRDPSDWEPKSHWSLKSFCRVRRLEAKRP